MNALAQETDRPPHTNLMIFKSVLPHLQNRRFGEHEMTDLHTCTKHSILKKLRFSYNFLLHCFVFVHQARHISSFSKPLPQWALTQHICNTLLFQTSSSPDAQVIPHVIVLGAFCMSCVTLSQAACRSPCLLCVQSQEG